MKALKLLVLASCLTILGSVSGIQAKANTCAGSHLDYAPYGILTEISRQSTGSTDGRWMRDEKGVIWYVKKDSHYNELQTSAEVISSQIFQHFGYNTPITTKVTINGVRFSASKDIGEKHESTDFFGENTTENRQLRVVTAYLKDWDRIGNPENNRKMPDGSLILLDFGGSLGARAQGHHKPGAVFSDAIGSFESTTDISVIYSSFAFRSTPGHPWQKINQDDITLVIEKFKSLSDDKITKIVKMAGYSDIKDERYMIQALKLRRDGIIEYLPSLYAPKESQP